MREKGFFLSLLTMVVSGVSIFANGVFVTKTDPLVFALARNALVALILSGLLLVTHGFGSLKTFTQKTWLKLVLVGFIGGGLPFALFFTGLSQIGAVNANILQKSLFIWVALLAIPLLREKVRPGQLLGYGVLFISLFFLGGTYKFTWISGTFLVLTATILWALENIISKVVLKSVSPAILSWARMVFGLPVLLAAAAFTGKFWLVGSVSSAVLPALGVSAGLLSIYMLVWYTALAAAPATLVSAVLVGAPMVTAVLAAVIGGRIPVAGQLLSLAGLATGVLMLFIGREKPAKLSGNH